MNDLGVSPRLLVGDADRRALQDRPGAPMSTLVDSRPGTRCSRRQTIISLLDAPRSGTSPSSSRVGEVPRVQPAVLAAWTAVSSGRCQ